MNKEILSLSEELTRLGLRMIKACRESGDTNGIKVGNILQLVGGVISDEEATDQLDNFLLFFSAKNIMDTVNPAHLLIAKKIAEMPNAENLMDMMASELMDDCDSCPEKDTCTDRHCANPKGDSNDEPIKKKRPAKKRTPKKPKNE